jgi:hypothetical protein
LVGFVFVGCQEYNISGEQDIYGEPNPKEIETPIVVDSISQVTTPEVDILYVVDNSCSMAVEQNALASNFPRFMDYFLGSGLDYHIGVVSTDMNDPSHSGKLREVAGVRYIDELTENPTAIFSTMAVLGTTGHYDEEGRAAAYTALELRGDGYNAGFMREDATLHVVVISDEPDASTNNPISLNEFIKYLKELKWDSEMVTFSSIVGPPGGCGTAFDGAEEGVGYLEITDEIGGIKHSICTEDWDQVLDELGMQAAGLKREYFLSQLPVPDSIEVRVVFEGNTFQFDEGSDWTYNGSRNSITFEEYVPDPLAEIKINYELLSAAGGGDSL